MSQCNGTRTFTWLEEWSAVDVSLLEKSMLVLSKMQN